MTSNAWPSRVTDPRLRARRIGVGALLSALVIAGCGGGGGSSGSVAPADPVASTPFTGRGYFVDAQAGDDAAAGTASAPWKTLARVGNVVLGTGDAILLKCGGTWRESLTVARSGAPAGGAILGAWGDCASSNRPVISGADLVSGATWAVAGQFAGKPVYSTTWSRPISALYLNGVKLVRARHPNYGGIGHEFALIDSVRNLTTLVAQAADRGMLARGDLAGAKAFVRTNPWLVESREVASSDGAGAFTLDALPTYAPQAAQGYFVEGNLAFLDSAGEWFHDAGSGQLYVWAPDGGSPANAVLERVVRDVGATLDGVASTLIDRIAFEKQAHAGIRIVDAERTLVTAVSSRDAGHFGILIEGQSSNQSRGTSVRGATIVGAGVNAISATSPAVEIVGNEIDGTGVGPADTGVSAGVYMASTGGSVRDNRISNSAYAAVLLSHAAGTTVSGNSLVQACLRFTDCGAIYSGGTPAAALRSSITSNAISDVVANLEGAVGPSNGLAAGVYLDEDSATHDVVNNMITRVVVGINLHNSSDHLIRSNQVWLADQASIRLHDSLGNDRMRGNVVEDNALYASSHLVAAGAGATAPAGRVVHAQEWVDATDATLMFSGNRPNVARRNTVASLTAASAVRWMLISGQTARALDVTEWSALAASETVDVLYPSRRFVVTGGGANLLQNSQFQVADTGWSLGSATSRFAAGSLVFGTCGSAGCADFTPGDNEFLTSDAFRMTSGELYQLQVRAQAIGPDSLLDIAVNRDGAGFAQLGLVLNDQRFGAGESVVDALFNATAGDPARLNISGSTGRTLRLSEVVLARVDSYELLMPARESALLMNETAVVRSVDCPSTVLRTCTVSDLSGQAIGWPVLLPPNSSRAVRSADVKWRASEARAGPLARR